MITFTVLESLKKYIAKRPLRLAIVLISLTVAVFLMTFKKAIKVHENYLVKKQVNQTVLLENEFFNRVFPPFLGNAFNGFKEALGFKESKGNYFAVNRFGYLGKYQFGAATLKHIGVHDTKFFLENPEVQEKAFIVSLQRNKWILRKEIERFESKLIYGIRITESGILAAAHLAGVENVKKYLKSFGNQRFKDANGASIRYYMKKFSGYDLSHITPDKEAKI
jgi:hypothetical protein